MFQRLNKSSRDKDKDPTPLLFRDLDKYSNSSSFSRQNIPTLVKLKLWFLTLFYHTSFSYDYTFDAMMEPIFWFVDHFTHLLGPGFVLMVVILVGVVVIIAHLIGLPFWLDKSPAFTLLLIIAGYWILVNLVFNFYMVTFTSPGTPSDPEKLLKCQVTICKKCISPKPPRTHHCSICNQCYLNMDHHCPWVNNCVGHFNRRYFLLTMVFIVMGCCFIMLFGVEVAFREVILDQGVLADCGNMTDTVRRLEEEILNIDSDKNTKGIGGMITALEDGCDETKAVLWLGVVVKRKLFRYMVYCAAVLCIGTSLALGGLTLWHGKLITMGETSIEYHINKAERKKGDQTFVNIYDLGKLRNWQVFLGLDQPGISFFRHILFPSSHKPTGDGYDWSFLTKETLMKKS